MKYQQSEYVSNKDWPSDFDFETDVLCQGKFKPFIDLELKKLQEYDVMRPKDITYIFYEHTQRVSGNLYKTCLHLGLGEVTANNMYWAILPHDIGKRLLPVELWDSASKPDDEIKHKRRTHTVLGLDIVEEALGDIDHPFMDLMCDIMRNHHEQMNGEGFHGLSGDQLSLPVRLASIVEAYDGWRIWRPHYGDRDISIPGVLKRMREEKGADFFDMELFEAFAEVKMRDYENGESYLPY